MLDRLTHDKLPSFPCRWLKGAHGARSCQCCTGGPPHVVIVVAIVIVVVVPCVVVIPIEPNGKADHDHDYDCDHGTAKQRRAAGEFARAPGQAGRAIAEDRCRARPVKETTDRWGGNCRL